MRSKPYMREGQPECEEPPESHNAFVRRLCDPYEPYSWCPKCGKLTDKFEVIRPGDPQWKCRHACVECDPDKEVLAKMALEQYRASQRTDL
jgi:hypothetical protein